MNNAEPTHVVGYVCLAIGLLALIATPSAFVLIVNDYFERKEEEQRLDYAVTPRFLRQPWYFALKDNVFKVLWATRTLVFAVWWVIVTGALIWSGINIIRHGG